MAGFENYTEEVQEIEQEIERKGIVLGIDWEDDAQVRRLAREALDHASGEAKISTTSPVDHQLMAKLDLFGLAGIMLRTMEESATVGVESHGGPAWKSFARALWAEAESRRAP
jgi:hypothetical protein